MGEDPRKNHEEEDEESLVREEGGNETKIDDFDGEILIVDDSELHIDGLRRLFDRDFHIGEKQILHSTSREQALEIAQKVENKLLLISDVYKHSGMDAVKFLQEIRKLKKRIYVTVFTGHIERGLEEMPELGLSCGYIDALVKKRGNYKDYFEEVLDNFKNGDWESKLDETLFETLTHPSTSFKLVSRPTIRPAPPTEANRNIGESASDGDVLAFVRTGQVDVSPTSGADEDGITTKIDTESEEVASGTSDSPKMSSYPPAEKPLCTWGESERYLPEEQKGRIIEQIQSLMQSRQHLPFENREAVEKQIRELRKELDELGGDTRQRLIKVLSQYEIEEHSAWHEMVFGEIEKGYFTGALDKLSERFEIPVNNIVVTDRGVGTGRSLRMLIDLVKKNEGADSALKFAKNLRGIDLMPSYIDMARQNLNHCGVLDENLIIGDFSSHLSKCRDSLRSGQAHLNICMMRTILYNVRQKELARCLMQIEKDLIPGTNDRPGGLAILDTVAMRRGTLNSMRNPQARSKLDDLKNLYPSLWRKYANDNQHLIPEGIELTSMRRYPIFDNTTGQGFYWREIITVEYIKHVIKENNLDLNVSALEVTFPTSMNIPENESEENFFRNIGRDFIEQNELEDIYRKIILKRIESGLVKPEEILGEEMEGDQAVEALMDYVAYHMVKGFGSEYIFLERPKLST